MHDVYFANSRWSPRQPIVNQPSADSYLMRWLMRRWGRILYHTQNTNESWNETKSWLTDEVVVMHWPTHELW